MAELTWGIMGTGGIAAKMVETLQRSGATVGVVGSERPGAAAAFAAGWGIPDAVDSHAAVAATDVDIVYIGTTNEKHAGNLEACIAAEKPVLCEKPFTLNAGQAQKLLDEARQAAVFVMEAMWMRFLPFLEEVDRLLDDGTIGDIGHLDVTFGHLANQDPSRRWMSRSLGGGSLLDLGIYPITLAHHLLGAPESFLASGTIGATGVDTTVAVLSRHAAGAFASLLSTFTADATNEAVISGSEGRIRLHAPFHHSRTVTVERRGEVVATIDTDFAGHGFRFEVAEAERCVRAGLVESPLRPHVDTVAVLEWLDGIRALIGLDYPGERD